MPLYSSEVLEGDRHLLGQCRAQIGAAGRRGARRRRRAGAARIVSLLPWRALTRKDRPIGLGGILGDSRQGSGLRQRRSQHCRQAPAGWLR